MLQNKEAVDVSMASAKEDEGGCWRQVWQTTSPYLLRFLNMGVVIARALRRG